MVVWCSSFLFLVVQILCLYGCRVLWFYLFYALYGCMVLWFQQFAKIPCHVFDRYWSHVHDSRDFIYHFVTEWHAVGVEMISTRRISMFLSCASLWMSWCSRLYFLFSCMIFRYIILGWSNQGPLRIILEAAGDTKDTFGWILCLSECPRNCQSSKSTFLIIISRYDVRRNSAQSMRIRSLVCFQSSIKQKRRGFT